MMKEVIVLILAKNKVILQQELSVQMDGWMNERMDGCMEGLMDG